MRRSEIPEALLDPRQWPGADESALDPERREVYQTRRQAVVEFLQGVAPIDIEKRHSIHRATLRRLLKRCLSAHQDGRIQGMRALIPHRRAKPYRRTKIAERRTSPGGLSGAMDQLFQKLPRLERIVERHISTDSVGLTENNRLFGVRDLHTAILAECRELSVPASAYPFNQDEMGYRALARLIRSRLESRVPIRPNPDLTNHWQATVRPFSTVELDGHKLDLRIRVRYEDPAGMSIDLECERLFVLSVIDVCTRIVIGWHLVPAPEYDRHDVLAALQDALRPRRRREADASTGLAYRSGAGFVNDIYPDMAYACWDLLRVGNAAAHLSEDTFEPICRFIGCQLEAGPVGEPTARPFIERFFGTLTERVIRKLPGTTGRNPQDPLGRRGRALDTDLLMTKSDLESLLEMSIANYHGTPHDGLNGRTPLEALQQSISNSAIPVRTLPAELQTRLHQLQPVHLCTVRGNVARGVPPYVSLYGARYSNEVLQRTQGLVKQKIRVYANPSDMREAWAYLSDGAELGRLHVLEGWRYSQHTLRVRQHILRERRRGKLKFSGEQDPIQKFADQQRRSKKRSRKQGTRALQVNQDSTPQAPPPARPRPLPKPDDEPIDLSDLDVQNI